MRARAAKIEPLDGCAVLRPSNQRTESEKLIERLFAVVNVAAAQPVSLLEIQRRDHLLR